MRKRFNPLVAAIFCFLILLLADLNLAAQDFVLPQPMMLIPVEPLDFTPDVNNSCMSAEGPEHLQNENGIFTSDVVTDAFTSCALTIFEPLLTVKKGTQKTEEATDALSRCSSLSVSPKHFILVGHGTSGRIATGNGTNPQDDDQRINNQTKTAIDKLRLLNASELVLFGCNTGAGAKGAELLTQIAKGGKFSARARNTDVMCYDGTGSSNLKGLYVFKGLPWITAQPNNADVPSHKEGTVDFNSAACFGLKGADQQFSILMSPEEFKNKKENRKIFVSDFRSEAAQRLGLFSEFELLPKGDGDLTKDNFHQLLADEPGINDIDFCQVLPRGMVPDRTIVGSFTITFDGGSRTFYELRGGLAQDVEHDDVYYPMKPRTVEGLAQHIRTKWNEKLNQLKQNKLQRSSGAGKAHN